MGDLVARLRNDARAALTQMLGGPASTVFPDDAYLVSYPRSGNTWVRFLLANLAFSDEPATFLSIEKQLPEIYSHFDYTLRRLPRPRLIKSHECFEPRYKRVIYIVRDPRDVAVSFYHFVVKQKSIPDDYPLDAFVEQWMEPRWWTQFGTWGEHVQSWLRVRGNDKDFLLIRYRDLQANTVQELARIATFLQLKRSREQLLRSIELSSADRMRAVERKEQNRWCTTKRSRLDKPFVRKAIVGDWRTALPKESVERIESAWGPLMEELGYPTGAKA